MFNISIKEVNAVLDSMILSASGWRGVFGCDEECKAGAISQAHRFIAATAGFVFAEYLKAFCANSQRKISILLGTDTRPTGGAIVEAMIPVLLSAGCDVRYGGVVAAPEIMAWARSLDSSSAGFIYVSASHNPIGYNGIKFGLTDGGVLDVGEAQKLIDSFRLFLKEDDCISKIERLILSADDEQVKKVYSSCAEAKKEAYKAYYDFCYSVACGESASVSILSEIKEALTKQQLGVAVDFNGSARTVSIDKEFFTSLGLQFKSINSEPGEIVHRIVPEGDALEPCCALLEKPFIVGYVPDCDGDRGNLVISVQSAEGASISKARALEAQEVFALACVAELAQLFWSGELEQKKVAVAINDPTSARIDRIAEVFGVSVFRAEVGEANVVALARRLRKEGYLVRILGEGSAGGNITHPSAVRDPVHTVLAVVKLLAVRRLFKIWCERSGQPEKYRDDFSLADIIESLPRFATTPAYSDNAVLRINTKDHALLKDRYQKIFLKEWEDRKEQLKQNFGFCSWEAAAYNGLEEKRNISRFSEAGKGGLKIRFFNGEGMETAYIWMRGSATEPVFRVMADTEDNNKQGKEIERLLLDWQRSMIIEADKGD